MARRARTIGWVAIAAVVAALLTFGGLRDRGPRSDQERIDAIAKTIKCPICNGESVFVSRVSAATNIRNEIARRVSEGRTDDEIRAVIEQQFPGSQLVPPATGFSSLIWVLPVVGGVLAAFGLVVVFRRWRVTAAPVSDDDRALVAAALAAEASSSSPAGSGVEP
jgi:cytochrome c-type biogenesis protein CcmH